MSHDHHHHDHSHSVVLTNVSRAFIIGIVLNSLFVVIEVVVGIHIKSLSLLSDAGHNIADVGSLALSLLAFKMLKIRSNDKYTYGYKKTSILAALFNAMILLVSIGAIIFEAIRKFRHPIALEGTTIAIVAGIGIVINFVSATLFMKNKDKDINQKSAYLHLMSDAVVSLGLVVGGIVIYYSHWYWLDPVLSLVIAFVILASTWNLLKESLRLSLDGVPKDINIEKVKAEAMLTNGLKDIHHIHVWAISTTENAMTGHLVLDDLTNASESFKIKNEIKHRMEHLNIQHVTLETEYETVPCATPDC
ncbi:MAG: cation diffusion facilitator family transporter [Ginsengibacter sp.]